MELLHLPRTILQTQQVQKVSNPKENSTPMVKQGNGYTWANGYQMNGYQAKQGYGFNNDMDSSY